MYVPVRTVYTVRYQYNCTVDRSQQKYSIRYTLDYSSSTYVRISIGFGQKPRQNIKLSVMKKGRELVKLVGSIITTTMEPYCTVRTRTLIPIITRTCTYVRAFV